MIQLTNSVAQTVAPGDAVTFDIKRLHTGNGECHRNGTSSVKLRAKGGSYQVHFDANFTGSAAGVPVELTIQAGGENIPESRMVITPASSGAMGHAGTTIPIVNCCGDFSRVTIVNTGAAAVVIDAFPNFYIRRVS